MEGRRFLYSGANGSNLNSVLHPNSSDSFFLSSSSSSLLGKSLPVIGNMEYMFLVYLGFFHFFGFALV